MCWYLGGSIFKTGLTESTDTGHTFQPKYPARINLSLETVHIWYGLWAKINTDHRKCKITLCGKITIFCTRRRQPYFTQCQITDQFSQHSCLSKFHQDQIPHTTPPDINTLKLTLLHFNSPMTEHHWSTIPSNSVTLWIPHTWNLSNIFTWMWHLNGQIPNLYSCIKWFSHQQQY